MPAQGRGAFLRPPPPVHPPVPAPHPLASVIHAVVRQTAQAVHPAVVQAQRAAQGAAPAVRHVAQDARNAQRGVHAPLSRTRGEVSRGLLEATIRQNPLLRAQLEGRLTADQINAKAAAQQILQQHNEAAKKGSALNLGFVNLTPIAQAAASFHPLGVGNIAAKIGNEVLDLPGQSLLSGAQLGLASRRALEGNTAPLEGIGDQALQQILHPVKSFEQAPLSTALVLAGGENVIGRLAGRLGRTGEIVDQLSNGTRLVRKDGLIPGFTRERPDLQLYGDLKRQQRYNPDPLRKAAQVAYEKTLPKLPGSLRQADPFQAEGWRLEHNVVGGAVHPGRVDYMRAAGERTRRVFVNSVKHAALSVAPKEGRDAIPLIFQGIVKHAGSLVPDLQKERAKLERAVQGDHGLTPAQLEQNRANLKRIEGLLGNEKFLANPEAAFTAAERLKKTVKPLEAILVHGGVIAPDALRAKLFPYAQAHMGAEYASEVNPREQLAYDSAKAEHDAATQRVTALEAEIRARTEGRGVATGARDAGAVGHGPVEAQHAQLRDLQARLAHAQQAVRDTGERLPPEPVAKPGMRRAGGGLLSDAEILAHMRANGVNDVGFMSHKAGLDSSSSFYQATTRLPGVERFHRTGSAFEKGTADHSWEALVGSIAQKASRAAQLEVRTDELNKVSLHPAEGGFASRGHAAAHAANQPFGPNGERIPNGLGKLVPVPLGPKEIEQAGQIHPQVLEDALRTFGLHNEKSLVSEARGRFGLIPEEVNKRIQQHDDAISAKSNIARGLQAYQNAFRAAKLNTSTRHIFGVGAEQAIRLAAEQAGPTAWAAGKKVDEAIKEAAGMDKHGHLLDSTGPLGAPIRKLEAQLGTRGGQVQGYKDMRAIRAAKTWSDTTSGRVARNLDGALHSTAAKPALAAWHVWSKAVEGSLARLEQGTHHALLGKALKETGFINSYRDVLKLQDDAMHELVTTGITPDKADFIARKVDDMMGNWSHLTPTVRKAVSYVTPFGLWWLNSVRWLYRLPVTHPIKTALASSIYNATRGARNAEGQGFDAAVKLPDWLQGQIATNVPGLGKGHTNPAYYSPVGIGGPGALDTAIEQFLPQLASPVYAALGLSALAPHKELTGASGSPLGIGDKVLNTLVEGATGPIPFATQVQQLLQQGGKPYGTANVLTDLLSHVGGPRQVKPGTQRGIGQVLEKMLLPERFAYDTGFTGAGAGPPRSGALLPKGGAAQGPGPLISPAEKAALKKELEALRR